MSHPTSPFPDFAKPPVIEVVLSVQIDPLPELQSPHLGLLWNKFRSDFPKTQQHPPLDSVIERFGVRKPDKVTVNFQLGVPVSRHWFLNEAGTELIQVQQDRFAVNWRKGSDEVEYPHYTSIRSKFQSTLDTFCQFLADERLGDFVPNQCEVTYVNHIFPSEVWEKHGQLDEVMTVVSSDYSDAFLPKPEDIRFAARYVIPGEDGNPIGRLHTSVEPAYRSADSKPIFVLQLTARGRPVGEGIEGIFRFLDIGHEWIVRGFTSITTPRMHKIWERRDVS